MKKLYFTIVLTLLFFVSGFAQHFSASYSSDVFDKPFTGNVFVYMSKENSQPKNGAIGLERFPCFSVTVKNIKPNQVITIDDAATSFPTVLSDIERGEYYVQIVWDRNLGGRSIAHSPGNLFNATVKINITKDSDKTFQITANKMIPEVPDFKETKFVKELKAPSALLTKFHGMQMTIDGAVVLPKEYYEEPNRKFPVLFYIDGFGGDYHEISGDTISSPMLENIPIIRVYLDGNCSLGHSVYANSDNNGPWGDALVKEFIPLLEKKYKADGARLLSGHSSGGWSVLWLQTQYPQLFAGCWASAPDSVDFRSYQKVNLYEDKNIFFDAKGSQRLVATVAGFFPWVTMKTIFQMENVINRGEQMHSFDAVYSKKRLDGIPERICNSDTGEIDNAVFQNWKKYDIALYLRTNWPQLKPTLDGKVRVSVGYQDNFLLNYPVYLLDKQMKDLKSTFQFAYYPGDHFTVSTPEYDRDGNQFLKDKYQEWSAKYQVKR